MILVDTSVWIDHLHRREPRLAAELEAGEVGCHELVIEELGLGNLAQREVVLESLSGLDRFPRLTHSEVRTLVDRHRLWSRGLGAVDMHLIGSARLAPGGRLWTRDKRLAAAARDAGVAVLEEDT